MCKTILTMIALSLCLAYGFGPGSLSAHSQESAHRIAKGEKMAIQVLEQDDLNGAYSVASDGTIQIPLIPDRINAAGLTYDELAGKIKAELEKKLFYNATVIVSPYKGNEFSAKAGSVPEGGIIYVYGAVRSAGAVIIPKDEVLTISKVLIRCGGFGDFSDKQHVKLIRKSSVTGQPETKIVNMVDVIEKGKLDQDVEVRDGDMIVVPEKFFNF